MTEIIVLAFVLLAVRSLYKTFLQPGWHKSETYRKWRSRDV